MRTLAFLLLLACARPIAGDDCSCGDRGLLAIGEDAGELICQRIRDEAPDGGVSFPNCESGSCCQWEAP
jgi:hypothetical protein